MARKEHGGACPEAERPFASDADAARLDHRPVGVCKSSWPIPRRYRWSVHIGHRLVPRRPILATAEPDASAELDFGPLGGGPPPIAARVATTGMLSGRYAHHTEPAVSGTVNRAGPVTDRDTRLVSFLIPLNVSYKSSLQIPAASPCARAAGGAPWERRAALQPLPRRRSRAASAELAHTAPPAVARWLWCGDAGTSAGSTGLHNVRKQRSARLSLVLCSGELGGRSVVRRCRLPSVCCLRPPQPVPAPLALVPRDLVRTQGGRPATGATGLHTPPPKKKHTERVCGSPLPALPLSLCAGFTRRPSWSCLLSVCWWCRCCRHS